MDTFCCISAQLICRGSLLGSGSYGRVYSGSYNGHEVAIKDVGHKKQLAVERELEVARLLSQNRSKYWVKVCSDSTEHAFFFILFTYQVLTIMTCSSWDILWSMKVAISLWRDCPLLRILL